MKLCVSFILALALAHADFALAEGEIGRFQIVSGTTQTISQVSGSATAVQVPIIIKIDTKTGETWVFASIADKKLGYREGWMPLQEYLSPPAKQ